MGARLVLDLNPSGSSSPQSMISIDGMLYFTADLGSSSEGGQQTPETDDDGSSGEENAQETTSLSANQLGSGLALLKSDGTADGTRLLKEFQSINDLVEVNGELYFIADDGTGTNQTGGNRLWRSDGTARGTVLVKDLFPGADPNFPQDLFEIDGVLFYSAVNSNPESGIPAENGYELWRREGNGIGSPIFKNIIADKIITEVIIETETDADTGETNTSTTITTSEVTNNSFPRDFAAVNGNLFFVAATPYFMEEEDIQGDILNLQDRDIVGGYELWFSDGTESGTRPIVINTNLYNYYAPVDVNYEGIPSNLLSPSYGFTTNSASSFPRELTSFSNNLVFTANDGFSGFELWAVSNQGDNPRQISDLSEGNTSSSPEELTVVGNRLYFTANTSSGRKLWSTTTNLGEPTLVENAGDEPKNLSNIHGQLYFSAKSELGRELWVANGNSASLVADINLGSGSSSPRNFTSVNHWVDDEIKTHLYFSADDGNRGVELWSIDLSNNNSKPERHADILSGPSSSEPRQITNAEERLYFTADDGQSGRELWTLGVFIQSPIISEGNDNIDINAEENQKQVYQFTSNSTVDWSLNGGVDADQFNINENGSLQFKEAPSYEDPKDIDRDNNYEVVIRAIEEKTGTPTNLMVNVVVSNVIEDGPSDGVIGGDDESITNTFSTTLIKNIHPDSQGSNPANLTPFEGTLLFSSNNGKKGTELWQSLGSKKTTNLLKDINKGPENSNPTELAIKQSQVYFSANDGRKGQELWISDGEKDGTELLADINPGQAGSFPSDLLWLNQDLFFTADDGHHGRELWKYSKKDQTSSIVLDIQTKSQTGSNPSDLTELYGQIVFAANDQIYGRELWISDGTAASTRLLEDINPGGFSSNPSDFNLLDNKLYFTAENYLLGGTQIMRLEKNTHKVNAIEGSIGEEKGSDPSNLHASEDKLFYAAATKLEPEEDEPSGSDSDIGSEDPGGFMIAKDGLEPRAYDYIENYNNNIDLFRDFNEPESLNLARFWADSLATSRLIENNDISLAKDWNRYYQPLSDQSLSTSLPIPIPEETPSNAATRSTITSPGDSNNVSNGSSDENSLGRELWISNGETNGNSLLKDINPGVASSNPSDFSTIGSKTYFSADNGRHGEELWMSDGTPEGTIRLTDINEGLKNSSPRDIVEGPDGIYFSAIKDKVGRELWRLDEDNKSASRIITSGKGKKKLKALEDSHDEFRFELADQFGKGQADRVTGFSPDDGDKLVLSSNAFPGLSEINLVTVSSKRQLKAQKTQPSNIIYFEAKGKLYFDQNETKKGYGEDGGLFAILKGGPDLTESSFEIV